MPLTSGLAESQILTLYTTPVIYLWFQRLSDAWSARGGSRNTEALVHATSASTQA